jgi:hypothetical protein
MSQCLSGDVPFLKNVLLSNLELCLPSTQAAAVMAQLDDNIPENLQKLILLSSLRIFSDTCSRMHSELTKLAIERKVSETGANIMKKLNDLDRKRLENHVKESKQVVTRVTDDVQEYVRLTRALQQDGQPWIQLYHDNKPLREVAYAFSVIGCETTRHALFYPLQARTKNTLTAASFSYDMACDTLLLRRFLQQTAPHCDVNSEQEWNQLLKPFLNKKRFSISVSVLHLLSQLVTLPSERRKPNWLACASLSLEKYLESYVTFAKQEKKGCLCESKLPLGAVQGNSAWRAFLGSEWLRSQTHQKGKNEKLRHLEAGWKDSTEIKKRDHQISECHALPLALVSHLQKTQDKQKRDGAFWTHVAALLRDNPGLAEPNSVNWKELVSNSNTKKRKAGVKQSLPQKAKQKKRRVVTKS